MLILALSGSRNGTDRVPIAILRNTSIGRPTTHRFRSTDNPQFDPNLLTNPWDGNVISFFWKGTRLFAYGSPDLVSRFPTEAQAEKLKYPPLVVVAITPRKKPKPTLNWLAKNPWVASIIQVIPVVGQYVAAAIIIANAVATAEYIKEWKMPSSAFEPQYEPMTFPIVLPLDMAQEAVREPWYAPVLNDFFVMASEQQALDTIKLAKAI